MINRIKGYYKLKFMAVKHNKVSYEKLKKECKKYFNKVEILDQNAYYKESNAVNFILDENILVVATRESKDSDELLVEVVTRSFVKCSTVDYKIN